MKHFILTCEHAGNEIPAAYEDLFAGAQKVLETHQGYDPGALDLFRKLTSLGSFSQEYMISRLLVEPNRSLAHPKLFSEFTRALSEAEKEEILELFYFPYRSYIEGRIRSLIEEGRNILHLSVHTFTPVLQGEVRSTDIGLLFDPARVQEADFCMDLRETLLQIEKDFIVKFNYPYLGVDDGFTTYLRKQFPDHYTGIELEVNQKFVQENGMSAQIKNIIFEALREVLSATT